MSVLGGNLEDGVRSLSLSPSLDESIRESIAFGVTHRGILTLKACQIVEDAAERPADLASIQRILLSPGGARTVAILDDARGWHLDLLLCADTLVLTDGKTICVPPTISAVTRAALARRIDFDRYAGVPMEAGVAHAIGLIDVVVGPRQDDESMERLIRRLSRRANGEGAVLLARKRIHPEALEACHAVG